MIWDHFTGIWNLQNGRVLREWPVISLRPSLHLIMGLLCPQVPLRLSPDLLQTWPKYVSWSILVVSLPMKDCMCTLVMWSRHDIPKQLSPVPHLKGWYCSPAYLSYTAQLEIPVTPSWLVSLLLGGFWYLCRTESGR